MTVRRTTDHVASSTCCPGAGEQVTECGRMGFPWWHSVQDTLWQQGIWFGSLQWPEPLMLCREENICHLRGFHLVVLFRVHPASLHLPWGKARPPVETQQGRTSTSVFLLRMDTGRFTGFFCSQKPNIIIMTYSCWSSLLEIITRASDDLSTCSV